MGFFTQRERADLDKSTDDMKGKFREIAYRDYAPRRRAPEHAEHESSRPEPSENYAPRSRPPRNDRGDGNPGRLLEQMTADGLRQIDRLLAELRAHRERLLSEGARVQQAVVEYARLSQSTMRSTKMIAESLTHWSRAKLPGIVDADIEDHAGTGQSRADAGTFVQPVEEDGRLAAAQPDAPPGLDSASGEMPEASDSRELAYAGAETTKVS
jgi:hypothetical protein